ncbi:hypothetical protein MRX96_004835 [Rhipicephalus microplus]
MWIQDQGHGGRNQTAVLIGLLLPPVGRKHFSKSFVAATAAAKVRRVCDIDVESKFLATNTCASTILGVDVTLKLTTSWTNFVSAVPVVSCARQGQFVTLAFEGTIIPPNV